MPRGIGADRHVHEVAELGEVGDVGDQRLGVDAVDPRDEAHVLRAGQLRVEAAAEPERPGDRAVAADRAGVGLHQPGDHADQRRLAGAVAPEHPDLGARRQRQAQPVDDHLAAVRRAVFLREVAELDHAPALEPEEQHVERGADPVALVRERADRGPEGGAGQGGDELGERAPPRPLRQHEDRVEPAARFGERPAGSSGTTTRVSRMSIRSDCTSTTRPPPSRCQAVEVEAGHSEHAVLRQRQAVLLDPGVAGDERLAVLLAPAAGGLARRRRGAGRPRRRATG